MKKQHVQHALKRSIHTIHKHHKVRLAIVVVVFCGIGIIAIGMTELWKAAMAVALEEGLQGFVKISEAE